jgi:hypothetical protein
MKLGNWCMRGSKLFLLQILAIGMAVSSANAQVTGRGSISGTLSDSAGSVLPKTDVKVTNAATGVTQDVLTNATGFYEVDNLIPGPYSITVSSRGFKSLVRTGIIIDAEQSARVDLALAVGESTDTVTVSADAPLINTNSGMEGQVTTLQMIQNDPTPGANPVLLLKFSRDTQTTESSNYYMNGSYNAAAANSLIGTYGQLSKNEFTLDGAVNQEANHELNYPAPSDELAEMVTDSSGFDAQEGKTLGLSVAMSTKGGANEYHGSVRDLYEDQRWQSLTHFGRSALVAAEAACATETVAICSAKVAAAEQPHLHENNGGLTIGGPVIIPKLFNGRDKLFFFFSTIRDKFASASPLSVTVPTLQERAGDFSDLPGCPTACGAYTIYDPLTVRPNPAKAGQYIRTAFPGNVIPANRLANPEIAFFNKELPTPNNGGPVGNNGAGNYTYTVAVPQLATSYTERVDYALTQKDHFYFRSSKFNYSQDTPDFTADQIGYGVALMDVFVLAADWTHTFSNSTVLDLTAGYDRNAQPLQFPNDLKQTAAGVGLPSYLDAQAASLGLDQLPLSEFAASTSTPYTIMGRVTAPTPYFKVDSIRAALTTVHGAHSVRAGASYRQQVSQAGGGGNAAGELNYDNTFTRQYSDTTGSPQQLGLAYAAFLLGIQSNASLDINARSTRSNPYYDLYVQDTWRVSPRVTVNAGLRFEHEFGPTEKNNEQITYFDPKQQLPIATGAQTGYSANYAAYVAATPAGLPAPATTLNVIGGSIYAGVNGASRRAWENNERFLPRVAVNYAVSPRTVVHAGFGLFYDTANVLNIAPDQSGFSQTTNDAPTNDNGVGLNGDWVSGNPYASVAPITNPFPVNTTTNERFVQPVGSSLGNMYEAGNGWTYYPANYVPAYQERWQGAIERQLGSSMALIVNYNGALTRRITLAHNQSFVPAAYFTGGNVLNPNTAALNANVPNPFYISNFASLQTSNTAVYNNVIASRSFFTNKTATYASLLRAYPQMSSVSEQTPNGQSTFHEVSVSWTRRMHDGLEYAINYQRDFAYDRDYYANSFDPAPSWEDSNNSRPSRFTVISVYELPFGRGKKWATSGWKSAVFSGFNLNGSYVLTNGPLLSFGNLIYNGSLSAIKKNGADYGQWFNTANFDTTPADQLGAYNLRVFPTHIDGVRQVGENNLNLNLQKTIAIRERFKLQARYECFDVFNHGIVTTVNTTPTSATFGQVTGNDAGGPFNRAQQVEAKIIF